jgi:hypothetical protein
LAILAFVLVIIAIVIFKVFTGYDQAAQDGIFFQKHIMSLELIDFWQMSS